MGRCRCDPIVASACACSLIDSTSIDFSGAGTSGNPFTGAVKLDPATGNQIVNNGLGLLVPTGERCQAYATVDQFRADGDTIGYNAETTDPSGMHSIAPGSNHLFNILTDGWYEMIANGRITDDAALVQVGFTIQDTIGNEIGKTLQGRIVAHPLNPICVCKKFLTAGTVIQVRINFTGPVGMTVQGGGMSSTNFTIDRIGK